MARTCMAANGTGSLVFIDDMSADRSSRMNAEVFRALLSAQIKPSAAKLIGRRFTVEMDSDPKYTVKSNSRPLQGKEVEYSSMAESVT
ncbi:hypothetical protein LDENG_00229840 [Lucifuga dentata]|nr:hypothetical protein LDENG_00229840 [Lucifuga dentata]